jgi:RND family efflux transporter MFP subunit
MRAVSLTVVGFLAAVAVAACTPQEQAKKEPPPAPPPPMVTVAKPVQRTITEQNEYVGRFLATDVVEMRARVSGYLDSVAFTDGQIVEKGQMLFTIDKRPYTAALDQARADLARGQARLDSAVADLNRSERLIKDNNLSAQLYDQRVAAKRDADAQLESAEAQLRRAQLDLEFTELRSPQRGRIGDRRVAVGNLVTGGTQGNTTLLATIVSLDPIHFEFQMDEAAYLKLARVVRSGNERTVLPVALKLLDETGFVHKGVISFVDNVLDQSSGTIRMRATFPNPDDLFTPGMFARVQVPGSDPYEAILVPEAAVMSDQSRKLVLVVGPDNVVQPRPVVLGVLQDGMRVVKSGLGPDDQIIVNGLMKARPGSKVNPQPAGQPPGSPAAAQNAAPNAPKS